MKILHISTYDIKGGAARATERLHRGLRELGEDSQILVRDKKSEDPAVIASGWENSPVPGGRQFILNTAVQTYYIDSHRTELSDTFFSLGYPGCDISQLDIVRDADIINLHWIARYQSPMTLHRLFLLGKPVVWTLHDQWPFTGGCHYAAGCEKYRKDCNRCPQLSNDTFDLPAAVLKDKLALFKSADLTIVSPSRWLATCAGASRLFMDLRIEVIPNSVETDVFAPIPKAVACRSLGLSPNTLSILFASERGNEKRKGFQKLIAAIKCCSEHDGFRSLIKANKIKLISFGYFHNGMDSAGIPLETLGYLDSNEKIAMAYCASDFFVLPSLEDNLPNTMLEAMSCGTPVLAFDVGGIPDAIQNGITGELIPSGDVRKMADAILSLLFDDKSRKKMQQNCRKLVLEKFSLDVQARQYLKLYKALIQKRNCSPVTVTVDNGSKSPKRWGASEIKSSAPIFDPSVGPSFKAIQDSVVLKALTELAPVLYEELQTSNADREARLKAIHHYQKTLKWYENNLEQIQEELKESNADRDARLKSIRLYEEQIYTYQTEIQRLQEARATDLEQINNYRTKVQELEEQIQVKETEYRETLGNLEERITYLSTAGKALRILIHKVVYRSFLKKFFDRYYEFFDQTFLFVSNPFRFLRKAKPKRTEKQTPSVNSPIMEAFVAARNIRSDMDEQALELFYQIGMNLDHVLCVSPSACNDQTVYMLSKAGAKVTYITGNKPVSDQILDLDIKLVRDELGSWMAGAGERCLAGYDGVVIDLSVLKDDLLLLKGRLFGNNRIFITTDWPEANPSVVSLRQSGNITHGLIIVDALPSEWLDPVGKAGLFSVQTEWPRKRWEFQFPPTLPSGRPWPKISVVTVTYNQGDYLEETLRSVLLQGYPNLDYIVIDGASTDNTPAILNRYENALSHCISEKDEGQGEALNKGFSLATGDIFAWLNSDDLYMPDTLLRVALAFDTYETEMVAGGCTLVNGAVKKLFRVHHNALPFGKPMPLPFDRLLNIDGSWQKGDFFYQPEVFWSREIWMKSGSHVDKRLFYSMDYELWVRMAATGAKIVHIPDVLALFRMHDNQKTSGEDLPFLGELRRVSAAFKEELKHGRTSLMG
ncbi:MAG: glycosyltransferase [Deltaproteobacteria bacterium]|nr:glycosyltransferase [Deltaproteobacteria bacterium]